VGGVKMTKDEVIKKFPVGSIVKVINNKKYEHICSLMDEVEVIRHSEDFGNGTLLIVKILKTNEETEMYYWRFENLDYTGDTTIIKNHISCPRCNGELKDHMSFGLGEMIKKCFNPDCGWC
jgi:hypothetical protein